MTFELREMFFERNYVERVKSEAQVKLMFL